MWRGTAVLAVLGCAIAVLFGFLLSWRPHVQENYGSNLSGEGTVNVALSAPSYGVTWQLSNADVLSVSLIGPAPQPGSVIVPVLRRACWKLAQDLGVSNETCKNGALAGPSSISASWSTAQSVSLSSSAVSYASAPVVDDAGGLDINTSHANPSAANPMATSVSISPTNAGGPLLIDASEMASGTTLTLSTESSSVVVPKADIDQYPGSDPPLHVQVGTENGPKAPPTIVLRGVSYLDLDAWGRAVDAQDLGGTLGLGAAGTDTLASLSSLRLVAASPTRVHVNVAVNPEADLEVTASHLAFASNGEGNLVTTYWDRHSDVIVPIFLAFVPALISAVPALFVPRACTRTAR